MADMVWSYEEELCVHPLLKLIWAGSNSKGALELDTVPEKGERRFFLSPLFLSFLLRKYLITSE